ncbi:MAG: guanylate kinase [Phycisphaerae bacterium]|nr:guanylate kinase [Phycisphaerae bacterium]
MPNADCLIVIAGPSGVGKSTIVREVIRQTGAFFSVSATTRNRRPNETDGCEYHFVGRATFEKMIAEGQLLEWAEVFGDYYGTPEKPVTEALSAGKTVILEIDIEGSRQVHQKLPEATFIFIGPPDEDELKRRLTDRGTESQRDIERRYARAAEEMCVATGSGIYNHMIVNDDLDRATRQVVDLVKEQTQK